MTINLEILLCWFILPRLLLKQYSMNLDSEPSDWYRNVWIKSNCLLKKRGRDVFFFPDLQQMIILLLCSQWHTGLISEEPWNIWGAPRNRFIIPYFLSVVCWNILFFSNIWLPHFSDLHVFFRVLLYNSSQEN